jgi:hypothetical protein
MTCDDHQSKKLYFVFDSIQMDPVMQFGNKRFVVDISKYSAYDVAKHAEYDDTVYKERQMKHGGGLSGTYMTGQSWADGPQGDSLIKRLFSPLTPLVTTTTPAFTGYGCGFFVILSVVGIL